VGRTRYDTENPTCLRRLDNNKVYSADWVGEVHADGEIWSQGLYEMEGAFGRGVATKIILQSHWSLTPESGFQEGLQSLLAADQVLYGGAHQAEIERIWTARGITVNQ
jgi:Zn-dependent metalloprotease